MPRCTRLDSVLCDTPGTMPDHQGEPEISRRALCFLKKGHLFFFHHRDAAGFEHLFGYHPSSLAGV